jgi:hypothetical protein
MQPTDPTPTTIGAQPTNAYDVNLRVGNCLREFVRIKQIVNQNHDWMAGCDLKVAPYFFTATQETDIKSALGSLDAGLDGIDMTFVNRLIGLV